MNHTQSCHLHTRTYTLTALPLTNKSALARPYPLGLLQATVSEPDRFQHIDKYSLLAEGFGQVSIAKNASARQRIVHGIESLPSFQAELLTVCHQHAEEMCGHWRSQCATDSKKKIDVAGPLQDTTLRVFFRCATGRDPTEQHIAALSGILAECRQRARDLFFIQRYDPRRLLKGMCVKSQQAC